MTKPTIISSNVDNVAGSKIVGSEEDCPVVIVFVVANMDHGLVPLSYLNIFRADSKLSLTWENDRKCQDYWSIEKVY